MPSAQVSVGNVVDGWTIFGPSELYTQTTSIIFFGADACAERLTTSPSTGGDSLAHADRGRRRELSHVTEVASSAPPIFALNTAIE